MITWEAYCTAKARLDLVSPIKKGDSTSHHRLSMLHTTRLGGRLQYLHASNSLGLRAASVSAYLGSPGTLRSRPCSQDILQDNASPAYV
ncbi:hypothetical protein F442_08864 [Phytophthora nicotianae P10297]|uniref:Uncharacterized protein n=1 Tax=Phytophthora nicotianae P10297 TaxID=1317064 RepID=W2ZBW1_PHYNI|nr:hypothetical protein F442_08864 [Phytophthora nicotianae P10297]